MEKNKEMRPASFRPFMREDVQLIIEPSASYTDDVNPLSACHEKFSRFSFAIIKDGKSQTMNMRWFSDTPESANSYIEFRELALLAKEMHLKAKYAPKHGASTPAFTLVFKAGRDTQGKTAAQVLKENPDGKNILMSQREFLAKNVAKYRSNQQYIDAIDEALSLTKEQINASSDSVELILFSSGLRSNAYKTNKNGKALCYDGSIKFYPGADSPLKVSITNYYASLKKDDKGLSQILVDTAEDKEGNKLKAFVPFSINLNFGETLRLFAELEEYFSVKYEELERKGINEAEKLLATQKSSSARRDSSKQSSDEKADQPVEEEKVIETESKPEKPKTEKKPTPPTTAIELKTSSNLSDNGNGDMTLKAFDRKNSEYEFVFPKEYWKNEKYGKVGEQFKKAAGEKSGIMVTLHFFVYNNKKYVAKIGK